ncbi:unnamed protein product [Staurois parvus]|uniref:Uncharacterized protein n=1 Tax=Staurois parvus TaxID=386267 RepID=A0ABN9ACX1_9NEOB|nr:unnamed protein product [Staurois parvus]
MCRHCTCSIWCVLLESACDQHRTNQHCPDRGQGSCNLKKTPPTSFNQCSAEHG